MSGRDAPSVTLPSLTGLRGVAALWVLGHHISYFGNSFALPKDIPILNIGWVGVDVFFALSGFILMLVHGDEFRTLSLSRVINFLRLRFFRVYPLATVVLLAIVVLVVCDPGFAAWYAAAGAEPNLSLEGFLRTLFLATRWWGPTSGDWNVPVWSLSIEILGYVAFPLLALLVALLGRPLHLIIAAAIWLSLPMVTVLSLPGVGYGDIEMAGALSRMFGGFVGGMMVFRLHQMSPANWREARGWLAVAAAIGVVVLPVGLSPFACAALVYGLAADAGPASLALKQPVTMLFGRISFPLFLLHYMPLLALGFHLNQLEAPAAVRWAALALFLVAVLAAATVLHVYVERPAHRFGRARYKRAAAIAA